MKLFDTMANFVSGLGMPGQDKAATGTFVFDRMSDVELEAAYRGDWLSAKIIDIPAFDMTREGWAWQADKDQITLIEAEEKRLDLVGKVRKAIWLADLYGGSVIIMDDGGDLSTPINITKKGGLRRLLVVSRKRVVPGETQWDPSKDGFDEPVDFTLNLPGAGSAPAVFHPSRVVSFIGSPVPDPETSGLTNRWWGDSVLQRVKDAVMQAGQTNAGIASLIQEAKVDVVRIPGLMNKISTAEKAKSLTQRFQLAAVLKSINNMLLLDKDEEWQRQTVSFTGLSDLQTNFLQVVAGAADIPVTRMLMTSPKGMNATGDSDLQMHEANMAAKQKVNLKPRLDVLTDNMIVSALGARPAEIFYTFNPLRKSTPTEQATIDFQEALAANFYAQSGLIPTAALEVGVQNKLIEAGTYPGLEGAIEDAKAGTLLPFEDPADANKPEVDPITGEPLDPSQSARPGKPPPQVGKTTQPKAANENSGHEITVNGPGGLSIKAKTSGKSTADRRRRLTMDAAPQTLYVSRKVLNADRIRAWAAEQGFKTTLPADDMHVTVAYSAQPVDWMAIGTDWSSDASGNLQIPAGGPRIVEQLGNKGAVVLEFASDTLTWRHQAMTSKGASWDFDGYTPHVTLTYDPGDLDLTKVVPYPGPILLGPEVFEALDPTWKEDVSEVEA